MQVVTRTIDSPLGGLIAGASPEGICLLEFPEPDRLEPQLQTIRRRLGCDIEAGDSPHLDQLQRELARVLFRRAGRVHRSTRDARDAVPGARVVGAAADSLRRDALLRGSGAGDRRARARRAPWDTPMA